MAGWYRRKQSVGTDTGTSLTVTFDEPTALDSNYVLVAVVQFQGVAADISSNSWGATAWSGSVNNGSALWLGAYSIRGDASTNSFTINFGTSRGQIAVCLMAFGWNGSASPDATPVASNNASGTSATAGPATATPGTDRVAIAAVGLSSGGGGTWGSFSNSFESLGSQSRLNAGVLTVPSAASTPSTAITWTSARVSRDIIWTLPGFSPGANESPTVGEFTTPNVHYTDGDGNTTIFVTEGEGVQITGDPEDADGTIASVLWTQQSGDAQSLSGTTTDTVTFTATGTGRVVLRFTATDDDGAVGYREVTTNIAARPWRPWKHTDGSQLVPKFFNGSTSTELRAVHPDGFYEPAGLVARWFFRESAAPFLTDRGDLPLTQGDGGNPLTKSTSPSGLDTIVCGGTAGYLICDETINGRLNIGAYATGVTVCAWVKRNESGTGFIAGQWEERPTTGRRAYALFNGLSAYSASNRVNGHVSFTGNASPGFDHSIDYSADGATITNGVWEFHAMTYDGTNIRSYNDAVATGLANDPGVANGNPYAFALGINPLPGDFTVGACYVDAAMGNFFTGEIALLSVYARALSADELSSIMGHFPT